MKTSLDKEGNIFFRSLDPLCPTRLDENGAVDEFYTASWTLGLPPRASPKGLAQGPRPRASPKGLPPRVSPQGLESIAQLGLKK